LPGRSPNGQVAPDRYGRECPQPPASNGAVFSIGSMSLRVGVTKRCFSRCRRNELETVEVQRVAATLPAKRSWPRATAGFLLETRENGQWRPAAALWDRLACLRHRGRPRLTTSISVISEPIASELHTSLDRFIRRASFGLHKAATCQYQPGGLSYRANFQSFELY
jgi:hypothetical protein